MKKLLILVLAVSLPSLAQTDFYARPGQREPFQFIWQRPGPGGESKGRSASQPAPPPSPSAEPLTVRMDQEGYPLPLFAPTTTAATLSAQTPVAKDALPPARFFKAKLVTGILASPGLAVPVLLEAEPAWCGKERCGQLRLVGLATLAVNGRATVVLTDAFVDEAHYSANAVVFDASDRQFGVRGEVVDIAPALAADLIRAAIGGLADWVRALNNQTSVTVLPGGGAATSFQAGPLWAYALGRVGQVVAPPSDATALVRAVVVTAGSEVYVLTGVANLTQGTERTGP